MSGRLTKAGVSDHPPAPHSRVAKTVRSVEPEQTVLKGDPTASEVGLASPIVRGGSRDPAFDRAISGGRAVHLDAEQSHLSDPGAAPLTIKNTKALKARLRGALQRMIVSDPAQATGFPRETVITKRVASALEHGSKLAHGRGKKEAAISPDPVGQVLFAILEAEAVATVSPALGGRPQTIIEKDVPFAGCGGAALLPPIAEIDVISRSGLLTDFQRDLSGLTKQSRPQTLGDPLVHQRPIQKRMLNIIESTTHIGPPNEERQAPFVGFIKGEMEKLRQFHTLTPRDKAIQVAIKV